MDFSRLKADAKRWQTGLILLAVVAAVGVFHSPWIIWGFLGVVFVFAFHESMGLYGLKSEPWLYVVAGALWAGAAFYPKPEDLLFLGLIALSSLVAFRQRFDSKIVLPLLYPATPMLFLLSLYHEFGITAFVWLLFVVVSCDVGAYFAGKTLGKTPFSPSSPNKTVEGVAGGITAAAILGTIAGLMLDLGWQLTLGITLAAAVASIFGDLFESYLKRQAGVKDSGHILPGHGGVLDRVDGYLFAGVVLTLGLRAFS
ncbi:MAG: phosphatidate cytidylyltransferase [Campylobacterales bacterium]